VKFLSITPVIYERVWETDGVVLKAKFEILVKKHASSTLSTTDPTLTHVGLKPGLCGERPSSNHLSHSTASISGIALVTWWKEERF
jgi:hypothetical protein